jgi:short-subunit dehydrogenase
MNTYNKDIRILAIDFEQVGFEKEMAAFVSDSGGELSGLINNAGTLINKSFEEQTFEDIESQLNLNFTVHVRLTQALLPFLLSSKETSHVVNICSMGGYQGSAKFPGLSIYSAAKAALAVLTECLAVEYAGKGVHFNALALGSAQTEMLRQAFPEYESPMTAESMADYISDFTLNGHRYFNGKVLPVAGISR